MSVTNAQGIEAAELLRSHIVRLDHESVCALERIARRMLDIEQRAKREPSPIPGPGVVAGVTGLAHNPTGDAP